MSENRRYNVIANVRMSKEQKQWLTKEAKRNGCSISAVVRESVEKMKTN
jgi:predicted DNA-binding protein